jgi:hypothetical protein
MNAVEIEEAVSRLAEQPFDAEPFRSMNTKRAEREAAGINKWAVEFPYVNGGLFSGSADVPVGTAKEKSNEKAVRRSWTRSAPPAAIPEPRFGKKIRQKTCQVGKFIAFSCRTCNGFSRL